jgi:uncharacterized LabA/DUF88 family protein
VRKKENNYAFIDGQNLYLGARESNIDLDYKKLRIYLREKFSVSKAFLFLGYVSENKKLYEYLKDCGFLLSFKKIIIPKQKIKQKGNIDVHLAFYLMKNKTRFNKSIVVTSDGDFNSLIEHLDRKNKLMGIISPNEDKCSSLLKQSAKGKIFYLEEIKEFISK